MHSRGAEIGEAQHRRGETDGPGRNEEISDALHGPC